ncbi:Adenosylcobinamide-GDP ribazoletransferase [Geodia barretti]|uniref:Adenosylcobinamide-GDP ribazoletransferase n=1 Tax=Geodia barretti TaxID=519541 RepID=A0AA35SCP1_GEOBA|nr:Adenosylcobinamide-GDP ribazoletransferase [Geodia barretti]
MDLLLHWGYPLLSDEYRQFPPLLSAAILVVLLAGLTRALHLDGFMDCCDALLGGFDRERRLEILRDSHVGAFAVVGAISLLLVKVAAIMALPVGGRFWILLLFPCLSRWSMLVVLEFFPYARRQGIGVPFQPERRRWQLLFGLAVTVIATVALAGPFGLVLWLLATTVALAFSGWASRLLGGVTGDVYGAVNELAEASVLMLAAILAYAVSETLLEPIHRFGW